MIFFNLFYVLMNAVVISLSILLHLVANLSFIVSVPLLLTAIPCVVCSDIKVSYLRCFYPYKLLGIGIFSLLLCRAVC